jgi:hypothetical protein
MLKKIGIAIFGKMPYNVAITREESKPPFEKWQEQHLEK